MNYLKYMLYVKGLNGVLYNNCTFALYLPGESAVLSDYIAAN